ncbi:MAG: MBL fold hydrolase, partial [Candidatus Magasanikbacteria bacterium CG10_big_fil_rev_8_21_14_0_10_38_6]
LKDTQPLGDVDVLLCESTYGDRIHEASTMRDEIIQKLVTEAAHNGGAIMIPAFSIERTQELLYSLETLATEGKLPQMPIFVDSPLAIKVTKVFKEFPEYYDKEACKKYMQGNDFLQFPRLEMTNTKEESKKINDINPPKMIIAGAGMMNGGRILHHAHRYLSDPKSTLIIVGYQAQGSLGRRLYEGAESVKIFGDEIPVRCTVKAIGALSAHGDQHKLMSWVGTATQAPKKIYYVHGEPHAATALAHKIKQDMGISGFIPEYAETIEV